MSEKFNVTGMSCAACSSSVEKAVKKVEGVSSCSVSLLTNSMTVEGDYSAEAVISAVKKAGYGAFVSAGSVEETSSVGRSDNNENADTETGILKRRLFSSLFFLIILMYISMGHNMFGFPLPETLEKDPVAIGILQLLLSGIVLVINQKFFINGTKGLVHGNPNMDTLVALGSSVSFLYSVGVLFVMTGSLTAGKAVEAVEKYLHELYFESAAMILVLITVGKMLESISKGKTTDALKSLMKLAPRTATVIKDGKETTVPVDSVIVNDIFTVRPGESIPVDGVVIEGVTAVNESALTGESIPSDKSEGDTVSSGTVNLSGFVKCRATRVGQDTTLSQIIKMVSDASATKAPISRIADKVSGVFVPAVIAIALATLVIWLILGETFGFALVRGISVLVISCPCALGLATPVAIMVGNGVGAKNGILFKTAVSLENAGKIKIVALDKTGTVTKGMPVITDIISCRANESDVLKYAYSLEIKSEHPLAKAVVDYAEKAGVEPFDVLDFKILPGYGLIADHNGKKLIGGSLSYVCSTVNVDPETVKKAEELSKAGKTPLLFAYGDDLLGVIAVADVIKEDSFAAVKELRSLGIRTVMLTGDNENTAKAIGAQAGIDEVIAGVLPDGKEKVIRELQKQGRVAMVGDGINDAPALTSADVGIAIGAGTDVAIDSADVVLMKSRLSDAVSAFKISRATLRNIHQNLFWAFFYNAIGIPLAAGAFISVLGWKLTPMFGAAAMSLSSFCVVTNALRLNLIKVREKEVSDGQGADSMTKTLVIKGMMCGHCENRVKKALMSVEGVKNATADHKSGKATVELDKTVDSSLLKEAVEKEDYKVKKIIQ